MEFQYRFNDADYTIVLEPQPDGSFRARIGDRSYRVEVLRMAADEMTLLVDGNRKQAYTSGRRIADRDTQYVALMGREAQQFELVRVQAGASRRGGGRGSRATLEAQMPGQVTKVYVSEGEHVKAGQPLLILEAMKMEMRVSAPHDGVVKKLLVVTGQPVERGQQLAEVMPEEDEPDHTN